jgi:hypothetical protein
MEKPKPKITLQPAGGPPGTLVKVQVTGFDNEKVEIFVDSTRVAIIDENGTWFTPRTSGPMIPAGWIRIPVLKKGEKDVAVKAVGLNASIAAKFKGIHPVRIPKITLSPTFGPPPNPGNRGRLAIYSE